MVEDHRDYRTLYWIDAMDGPWSPAAVERYLTGGYDGLLYRPAPGTTHRSLAFLLDLPDLRSLTVHARVVDDSAVNDIGSLEQLTLLTRSQVPLAVDRLGRLQSLTVEARADLTAIRGLAELQALYLAGWRDTDLSFLGEKPNLSRLRFDGRPARLELDGIQHCPALTRFDVFNQRIATLTPLRELTRIETVVLSGPARCPRTTTSTCATCPACRTCAASDSSPPARSAPCIPSPQCRGCTTSGSAKSSSATAI